ncbi:F-box protein: endocytic membrane traffic, recycling ReCYcling 1 [Blastocladiella emersonii ATCC 22665]|nr:F-box protein: endocytic membrane traffic, recycling ReCYcling 1 [Blastocladiella emersonii ATCC 22665]
MQDFLRVRDRSGTATSASSSHSGPGPGGSSRLSGSTASFSASGAGIRLAAFPQDVTLRIFSFLPLSALAAVAACSRRLKVMAYNDVLYDRKLRAWYYLSPSPPAGLAPPPPAVVPTTSASLRPRPLDPDSVPLHVRDAWARIAPALGSATAPNAALAALGLPAGTGGVPGTNARDTFRRIHAVLWPLYRGFRAGAAQGAARVMDFADTVDQTAYFGLVKVFGRAALTDDFRAINENVHAGIQVLESQLLSSFDRAYETNDMDGMRQLAKCLFFLTGGDSCVQLFIYKSPIFFDHAKDVTDNFRALGLTSGAAPPPTSPPGPISTDLTSPTSPESSSPTTAAAKSASLAHLADSDSPLQRYLDSMSRTLESQLPVIKRVFPHPVPSQYAFVSKVFDECILDYLSRLLREAQSRDQVVFLASLTHMFEHCSILIRELAEHHGLDAARLEDMLHACLAPFTGAQYMDREVAHLRNAYAESLAAWAAKVAAQRRAAKGAAGGHVRVSVPDPNLGRRVLSSVKTVLLTPQALVARAIRGGGSGGDKYSAALALSSTSPVDGTGGLGHGLGHEIDGLASPTSPGDGDAGEDGKPATAAFDQLDALLSVDLVLSMITQNRASVKRAVVMMKRSGDVKRHVERLFSILLTTVAERHIRPSFEIATERLSAYKASEDLEVLPLIQFFGMIQVVDVLLQMVHLYFTEDMAQYVNLNDFLSDSIQEKKKFEKVIDDCVATGLDRAMLTLMAQSEFLLSTEQHPSDFDPPDEVMTDTRPTDACRMSVACLDKHIEMLRACAEKNILSVFLAEVGSRFFQVLSKHIRRQRISVVGGFRLMCDLNAYHAWAESLRNGEVARMFRALKELSNVFVVTDMPALKALVKDQARYGGVFRVEDVYEFIERRADYDRIKSKVKESECSFSPPTHPPPTPMPSMSTSKAPPATPAALSKKYQLIRELGSGAYGVVSSAKNLETGDDIAIKRVTKVFDKTILAKRALREIKLLRHFNGHENITSILDMEVPSNMADYNEIYLVQELMEADLHQIIRSEQPLTDAHFQYFVYQILRGLKYIHSANVLHRDLKPGNLLVNADCELKICDFGLARGFSNDPDANGGFMTEYVATRWYRAPEIMLSFQCYTKAIDMWSVGCIFGELLGGKPMFKGRDYVDQLNQILAVLGTPDDATLRRVGSQRAQVYIRSLPRSPRIPFQTLFPRATPLALDLLDKLLQFDPAQRITVEDALAHPYLATYHDPDEEPAHPHQFDFAFENAKTIDEIRALITREVVSWKAQRQQGSGAANVPPPIVAPVPVAAGAAHAGGAHRGDGLKSPDIEQARQVPKAVVDEAAGPRPGVDPELERELAQGVF